MAFLWHYSYLVWCSHTGGAEQGAEQLLIGPLEQAAKVKKSSRAGADDSGARAGNKAQGQSRRNS
jgi:hypothetical protein